MRFERFLAAGVAVFGAGEPLSAGVNDDIELLVNLAHWILQTLQRVRL